MKSSHRTYILLLLFIAGMGGFLYGYDIGIIGAALLYLGKTIDLSQSQESAVVAAVLGGGMISSVVAGALADLIGRKKVMICAALMFVASVGLIVVSQGFLSLFLGRGLQGLSAGMIAVVIPLYLAESLPAGIRGRGTAGFQLLLTIGILIALAVGSHYTASAEAAATGGLKGSELLAVQDGAWRAMFRSAIYPGAIFLLGAFLVTESPRWLFRRGHRERALAALRRSRTPEEAEIEFREMAQAATDAAPGGAKHGGSLLRRKYVVPFLLSCAVLGLNQSTGINSVIQFVVVILKEAGLDGAAAAQKGALVTLINVLFTIAGLVLVDKVGRRVLLMIGTGGVVAALACLTFVFHGLRAHLIAAGPGAGNIVMVSLMLFIAAFAIGPGVCVWLALSELMPTRIRSLGMGFGLLINQGISTGIAYMFLPVVGRYGYAAMFAFWCVCTIGYFLLATFLLPETKGKTLEEIEAAFE